MSTWTERFCSVEQVRSDHKIDYSKIASDSIVAALVLILTSVVVALITFSVGLPLAILIFVIMYFAVSLVFNPLRIRYLI